MAADVNADGFKFNADNVFKDYIEQEFINPTLAEVTVNCSDPAVINTLKGVIGKFKVNGKFICPIMDILTDDHAKRSRTGLPPKPIAPTPAQLDLGLQMRQQMEILKQIRAEVTNIATQGRFMAAASPPASWKATQMRLIKGPDNGFHMIGTLGEAASNPDQPIELNSNKAIMVRAEILFEARRQWELDEEAFQVRYGKEYPAFKESLMTVDASGKWRGEEEANLFTKIEEHNNLEIRLLYKDEAGEVKQYSSVQEGENRKRVGFGVLGVTGYTIGGITTGPPSSGGEVRYIFDQAEADTVYALLVENLLNSKKSVSFAEPGVAQELPKGKAEFIREATKAIAAAKGGAAANEEPWQAVAKQQKAQQQEGQQEGVADAQKAASADLLQQATSTFQRVLDQQAELQEQITARNSQNRDGGYRPQDHQNQAWGQTPQPQPQPWGQKTPASWADAVGRRQPSPHRWDPLGRLPQSMGEPVGPAVVVFGDGNKAALKAHLKELNQAAAAAVVGIHRIAEGAPRYHLHCRASQIGLVESLVPLLSVKSRAAIWKHRKGPGAARSGLAKQASNGLDVAASKAGMCRYFASQKECPFRGRCRYVCYEGPPRPRQ